MPTYIRRDSLLLLAFIMLLALCLRGPVVGIAPLIERIEHDLSLSSSASGLLTTLPLLSFAFFAPVATWLARRWQIETALLIGAVCILIGMTLRSLGILPSLYLGVFLIGAGIAVGNVLLPILLKRDFAQHIIQLTALYVLMMNVGGALMTGTAMPIALFSEQHLSALGQSWSLSLASQMLLVLVPVVLWFWLPKPESSSSPAPATAPHINLWRSPLAWLITLFIALDSVINYIVNAWLPTIYIDQGIAPVTAGIYHSYVQVGGALPGLLLPFLQRVLKSNRQLSVAACACTLAGLFGIAEFSAWAAYWSLLFGFGITLGFVIGIALISLRTDSIKQAAALSGMAQLVGYTLAAMGPVAMGALHDWLGQWQTGLYALIALCVIWSVLGWYASKEA